MRVFIGHDERKIARKKLFFHPSREDIPNGGQRVNHSDHRRDDGDDDNINLTTSAPIGTIPTIIARP